MLEIFKLYKMYVMVKYMQLVIYYIKKTALKYLIRATAF